MTTVELRRSASQFLPPSISEYLGIFSGGNISSFQKLITVAFRLQTNPYIFLLFLIECCSLNAVVMIESRITQIAKLPLHPSLSLYKMTGSGEVFILSVKSAKYGYL